MNQNFKNHLISIQEFQRKFYYSTEPDRRRDVIKRKPELIEIINALEPNFGKILTEAYRYFTTYTGKGEINVTFGTKVEITYFSLKTLQSMAENSSGAVKTSIEYSIARINNKHDKRIPFVVWDSDGRTYYYEFNPASGEIEFEAVLKEKDKDEETAQLEGEDVLNRFTELLVENSSNLEEFFEQYQSEVDLKGRGIYSVQLNENVSEPYKGFEMEFVTAKELREMHDNEDFPDERARLNNIINNLLNFETEKGYFLVITDFEGRTYDFQV